jgi:lipid-A-disaccharide synthase
VPRNILISAGEASGDLYAAMLAGELHRIWPEAQFFGCTGTHMRRAGVETVVDSASLAVVGLVEVVSHIPRIYSEFRKLQTAAHRRQPELAILTDSPDFHLRLARKLHRQGVPVVYLVAPQVWAWRKGRLPGMRRTLRHMLCIFPFEEQFFQSHGLPATYIGHPLAGLVKPSLSRGEFFRKHRLPPGRPLISVLPGSRRGEAARHLPPLLDAVGRLYRDQAASFILPASPTAGAGFFRERIGGAPIQVIDGENWDSIAHADLALAASGTVTVEAALLGTPMVTYYKVTAASWLLGRMLVQVPFYSMVNLIAGRAIVPELMQSNLTGERLAAAAQRLLRDDGARAQMRADLAQVAVRLSPPSEPMARASAIIQDLMEGQLTHVS